MNKAAIYFAYLCIYTTPIQLFILGWISLILFQTDNSILDYSTKAFLVENLKFTSEDVRNNLTRDLFKSELQGHGVNTIIYYPIPIHLQPAYKTLGYKEGSLPITEKVFNQVLSLIHI